MNNQILTILLKPGYGTSAEKLGLDPSEIYENDPILFQQGFDIEQVLVKPGEKFCIPDKFEYGIIDCTEIKYKLFKQADEDVFKKDEFEEDEYDMLKLTPGNYFFHKDGLRVDQYTEEWDDDDEFEEEEEPEGIEPLVFERIVSSAKRRFDYENFAERFNEIDNSFADEILEEIIVSLAANEAMQLLSAKLHSRFFVIGYGWDKTDIDDFLSDKKEVFKIEIYVLQMAAQYIRDEVDPLIILDFINRMLN